MLRPPRPDELAALTELCLRSKAYWGYDEAFILACRQELTLAASDLSDIIVSEVGGRPVGVAQVAVEAGVCDVLKLFVAPEAMGGGHGSALFAWCRSEARRRGATRMTIESDPCAQGFYQRMGARRTGTVPSGSIPGRTLPLLELTLVE